MKKKKQRAVYGRPAYHTTQKCDVCSRIHPTMDGTWVVLADGRTICYPPTCGKK